jgi:PPOX class probable F420-dependent enzyme
MWRHGAVGPVMELDDALAFARTTKQGVLITMRANGHPQLSNVVQHCSEDGVIRISVTGDRAKYINLTREPWAAMHVTRPDFFAYAVLEGPVELTPVAQSAHDAVVDELVDLYRALAGEHPDWDDYRTAMVAERRAVIRLIPGRAYGMLGR